MTYGSAPSSGGSGDAITTDSISTIDGAGGTYGEAQVVKVGFGPTGELRIPSETQPLPVGAADCISLLSTTLTATGPSSSIDTKGYGAVVVQLSGAWNGVINVESSNDGTVWDTVLVLSRDTASLLDTITSNGLYTIRPSGRYARFNVTNITGSMALNALGRAAEGISAADLLSLAMDESNRMPLGVKAYGALGRAVAQDEVSGAWLMRPADRRYEGTSVLSGTILFVAPCGDMNYILFTMVGSSTASVQVETQLPDGTWQGLYCQFNGASVGAQQGNSVSSSSTNAVWGTAHLGGAAMVRVRSTSANTIRVMAKLTNTPPPSMLFLNQAVAQATAANLLCTNTPLVPTAATNFNSAATVNNTLVKGSAGRITACVATNNGAAVCFLKLYNKATAPVAGTDVPVLVISIPANGVPVEIPCGPLGLQFATGIGFAVTNLIADSDTTAIAASQVKLMMSYV